MIIKALGGAVVVAVGLLLVSTGIGLGFGGSEFEDTYPINDEWDNSGTHDNTFSNVDGDLVINNLTANELDTGTFTSDIFTNGEIEINNIVYEASNIRTTGDARTIQLDVRGVDSDGTIIDEVNYTLENGRYSVPVEELQDQDYNGYQFVVNLEAEDDTSPELVELVVQGNTFSEKEGNLLSTAIGWLLFFVGLMVILRDVS